VLEHKDVKVDVRLEGRHSSGRETQDTNNNLTGWGELAEHTWLLSGEKNKIKSEFLLSFILGFCRYCEKFRYIDIEDTDIYL